MNVIVQCASNGSPAASAAINAAPGARTSTLQPRNDSQTSAPSPSSMPGEPHEVQVFSSIASRSSVERTPRSAPCVSRKWLAALRPSSRSIVKNGHSVRSLEE